VTDAPPIHDRRFVELTAGELYDLLVLRSSVFVVEQTCPYLDPDGRDREPATRHLWIAEDGAPVAYLRVMEEPGGGSRIGRAVTRADRRRHGYGSRLVRRAVDTAAAPIVLDAQVPQAGWYATFGFEVCGEPFDEDGILHVPMVRR
jgi:ElaA protein